MIGLFIVNSIGNSMLSTGAFEVYVDGMYTCFYPTNVHVILYIKPLFTSKLTIFFSRNRKPCL
jgi:hypothetical protein